METAARRLLRPFQLKLMFLIFDLPTRGDYCNFSRSINNQPFTSALILMLAQSILSF